MLAEPWLTIGQVAVVAAIVAVPCAVLWVVWKVLEAVLEYAYPDGPLWLRILIWPFKILFIAVGIYSAASLAREGYRWMNKPKD